MNETALKRILVIEDNEEFRKILQIRLESNGYETISAQDGLEGLNLVKKVKPDLIILDLMLPHMDGHKVCRFIKFDRSIRHIPIIILTSRDLDEDAEMAKQLGADAFILKTTRAEIMMDVVHKLLERGS